MTIFVAGNESDVFSTVSNLVDVVPSTGQGVNPAGVARAGVMLRKRATATITFPSPRQAGFFRCRLRPRGTGPNQLSERLLEFRDSDANFIFGLRQDANSGQVRAERHNSGTTVLIATAPATPTADDAFTLDVQWRMANNATGRVEIWKNGVSVFVWTGANLTSGPGPDNIASIIVRAIGSDTDTGENHNTHIGQMIVGLGPTFGAQVHTLPITAFGDTNDFAGSLSNITAAGSDDGAAISSAAGSLSVLFQQPAPPQPPAGWHLEAVVLSVRAQRAAAGATLTGRIKVGSTTYSTNTVTPGATFGGHQFIQVGNPALERDANRWTEAAIGGAQPGVLTVTEGSVISKAVVYAVTKLTTPRWTRTGAVVGSMPAVADAGGAFNALFIPERDRFVFGTTRRNTTLAEAWYNQNGFSGGSTGSTTLDIWPSNSQKGRHVLLPRSGRIVQLYQRYPIFSTTRYTAYSDDGGDTWTLGSSLAGWPADFAWSPELGLGVLVCGGGNIYTTTNGASWTLQTSGTTQDLWGVAWAPALGLFAVTGDGGVILTSTDGTSWTSRTNPLGGSSLMRSVAWSPELGLFAAVGGTGTGDRLSSSDGITWHNRGTSSLITPNYVEWIPGLQRFIAACTGTGMTATGHNMLESSDGVSWSVWNLGADVPDLYRGFGYSADRGVFLITFSTLSTTYTATSWARVWHMLAEVVEPQPETVVVVPDPVEYELTLHPPSVPISVTLTAADPVEYELFLYAPVVAIGGPVVLDNIPPVEVQTSGAVVWGVINPLLGDVWTPIEP